MSKIINAGDALDDARSFLKCVWMAAADLGEPDDIDAIQTVTTAAAMKIEEAIRLMDEYRTEMRLVAAEAPDAKPEEQQRCGRKYRNVL